MSMLVLDAVTANQVRGLTVPGHALAPVPLADGTFVLPISVLTDPYHKSKLNILSKLDIMVTDPRRGTLQIPGDKNSPVVNSDYSQDPVLLNSCTYESSWVVGEAVAI